MIAVVKMVRTCVLCLYAVGALDVLLYKIISTMEDYTATQGDINAIADWSDTV